MAATATISASTTHPVVGRSTMTLVGTSSPLNSPPGSPGATSLVLAAPLPTASSLQGQTIGGSLLNNNSSGAALASAIKVATASTAANVAARSAPPVKAPAVVSAMVKAGSAPTSTVLGTGHTLSTSAVPATSTTSTAPETTTSVSLSAPVPTPVQASVIQATTASVPVATALVPTPIVDSLPAAATSEATTFFDDMINAPQPPANILTLSPTTSLPDLYHDFFDNHPELYDSDQSSDPEMDLDLEDYSPVAIRARTMADMRQTIITPIQVPLIADRPKLETIDTINLMIHHQTGNNAQGHGRQSMNMHGHQHSADESSTNQTPQRRKKASRACFHCQKAHLTCDDARPCQRCVKRDLAGSCTDGVRKRAKYLQDSIDTQQRAAEQARLDQESQQAQACTTTRDSPLNDAQALFNFPNVSSITSTSSTLSTLTSLAAVKATAPFSPISTSPSPTTPAVPDHGFGSDAINLEYSILSTMVSSPTADLQSMTSELSMIENWQRQGALEAMANSLQQQQQLSRSTLSQQQQQQQGNSTNGVFGNSKRSNSLQTGMSKGNKRKFPTNTPENVYANTKQPFNYTDGFHYLLRYVRERMDKDEMMRVCRAMAMFRPSFIALIMNLTPEDLIFMETCFQRTVLEFEKLISFSGTPTVVWRRTGEIALVGKEFSLLTQWSRDQLLNKKTYIYELMDNQSAVEYWEKFSTHAFENTEQTVMTTCILLSPTNRVVPCTFCFTIKRDIFDIPLAIVGNFLPILA
ncbi:Transcriptional regulator of nonfermentable carbon utilization [Haplosporangium sp. Z 767]|nr:Transcriptional regulator of nonfermentable carbon utilization [Haplosporangium sp. Z 767]KAF9183552.1 Transcriptional regulator of nonfermentable carbon utilization [Haplosporangium sp. Z 11]